MYQRMTTRALRLASATSFPRHLLGFSLNSFVSRIRAQGVIFRCVEPLFGLLLHLQTTFPRFLCRMTHSQRGYLVVVILVRGSLRRSGREHSRFDSPPIKAAPLACTKNRIRRRFRTSKMVLKISIVRPPSHSPLAVSLYRFHSRRCPSLFPRLMWESRRERRQCSASVCLFTREICEEEPDPRGRSGQSQPPIICAAQRQTP